MSKFIFPGEIISNNVCVGGQITTNAQAVTYQPADILEVDLSLGNYFEIDLVLAEQNIEVQFALAPVGIWSTIKIISGSAGHNVIFPEGVLWRNSEVPTASESEGVSTVVRLVYDGEDYLMDNMGLFFVQI